MESIIKTVLDGNWNDLKQYAEQKSGEIINKRITDKKIDVLANLNSISRDQMEEIVSISSDK